jgi:hypothetical protein
MMPLLDHLKEWTDLDAAAFALGQVLGVFPTTTRLTDAQAVLSTNGAVSGSLAGMLERLTWLGVLECDDESQRYRSARARMHPLGAADDVPALAAGPPRRSHIAMSVDSRGEFRLEANRVGFRFLARLFDEVANSGLESGWSFRRDGAFAAAGDAPAFSFTLSDPDVEDPTEER